MEYWRRFRDAASGTRFDSFSIPTSGAVGFGSGVAGFAFVVNVQEARGGHRKFDNLVAERGMIEIELGYALEWYKSRVEGQIRLWREADLRETPQWPELVA